MRRFALIGALAVMLAAPVLAVGYSDGYGRGGTFGDYDQIIDKYNSSGSCSSSGAAASRPARCS